MSKPIVTKEWLDAFGPTKNLIRIRGTSIFFIGKRGAMFRCRIAYLAKREGISFRRFIIDAIKRGCGV